jgi:C1A family cysteine protease
MSCRYTKSKGQGVLSGAGYSKIAKNSPSSMMDAVAKTPITVLLDAEENVFQSYKSGIISDSSCGTSLDHAVLLIGYGEENSKKYWLLRNSWGSSWGEKGYFRIIKKDNDNTAGICGVQSAPVAPTL